MIIEKRTNLNDYKIIKTIGRGAFGRVQLVGTLFLHIDRSFYTHIFLN